MFFSLFNNFKTKRQATLLEEKLYYQISLQSRSPVLYQQFQIPDTPQGRFEMLVIHLFMVLYVLKRDHDTLSSLVSQKLVNFFVADLDQSFREIHISDKKMTKSFKYALEAFYGRLYSYDSAVSISPEQLRHSLSKNIYEGLVNEGAEVLYLLSDYIYHQIDNLKRSPIRSMRFVQIEDRIYGTKCSRI